MLERSKSVSIARPIGTVFAFLSDPGNLTQWRRGVIEVTQPRGPGAGATYRQVVALSNGRRLESDVEVTELVPAERIAFRTISGLVRPAGRYDLRPIDNGTEVTLRLATELRGWTNLLSPLVAVIMTSDVDALTDLKRALESRDRV